MTNETFQKLEYIISGYEICKEEVDDLVDLMETYAKDYHAQQSSVTVVNCQKEQFSLVDMKQAFEEGTKHKYECSANGKDKKCYCSHDDDCTWRNQQTFEEWMKAKEDCKL